MIEIIAKSVADEESTEVSVRLEGTGMEILNESLSAIRSLMRNLKHNSKFIHAAVLAEIASDPDVLLAKGGEDEHGAVMSELMSKGILKN